MENKRKNRSLLLFLVSNYFLGLGSIMAQPAIQWQRAFGGSDSDEATSVQQTQDGGYIVSGSTISFDGDVIGNHGGGDYWVLKLSETGQLGWKKTFGGTNNEGCYKVRPTSDGGYILAGYTYSNGGQVSGNHGDIDAWIVKINASGVIQWQKCFGGTKWDEAWSIVETFDGGYAFIGFTNSNNGDVSGLHGALDFWVVRLTNSGDLVWQKALGGSGIDQGYVIKQTADGGFIVAGESQSSNGDVSEENQGGDYWVVKLSENGEIEWGRLFGGLGLDRPNDIWQRNDGSYLVFGHVSFGGGDVEQHFGGYDWWLIQIDMFGNLLWEKTYGGSGEDWSGSICAAYGGGFVLAGSTNSKDGDVLDNDGGIDFLMLKVDSVGNLVWQVTYGGTKGEQCFSVDQTLDGGYITAGFAWSNNGDVSGVHGDSDFWIVKLAPETSSTQTPTAIPLNLYPNPATQWITLNLPIIEQNMQVSITDEQGKLLQSRTIRTDEKLDIAALPPGIYWVSAASKSGQVYAGKFVKR
ncbi:MAG: T9SS type A sorting domain-containing protein [Chitinophagales bacterium]|nr:T9SS type A sorting domain-containing protein [Chitinophagales bacterium]